jgi:outer membrane receptor for ferrienterochelin and colicin
MKSRLPFISLFICLVVSLNAQTSSQSQSQDDQTVKLDAFVVSDSLDVAREGIVPSLGATSYEIGKMQLDAESLGGNGSFNEILLRVPSVAEDSFGQVHLRGEHADLQYRINDVLLPEGISGFGQELDIPFIKSAAILTGSLPAQYGYRTAGVVDIHTESGSTDFKGSINTFVGSHDTLKFTATGGSQNGQFGGFTTLSTETNNLGIENPEPTKEAVHDKTNQIKFFTNLYYVINSTSRLSFMLSDSTATFQIPNSANQTQGYTLKNIPLFNSLNLNENQAEFNDYAILAYQKSSGDFNFQASLFTRYSLTHFTPDTVGDLIFNGVASEVHQDLISNGLELDSKWDINTNHTLRFGTFLSSQNANTKTNTAVFPTDDNGDQTSTTAFWIQDSHHRLGWLIGTYIQDEWKLPNNITVNGGLRFDTSHGALNESQVSPRINTVWQAQNDLSIHLGYARYFTPPAIELVDTPTLAKYTNTTNASEVLTNSAIASERSNYLDFGLTKQLTPTLSLEWDSYLKKATHLLDEGQFGQAVVFNAFNYTYGEIYGSEISLNYTTKKLTAYLNAAEGRAYGKNISSGQFEFDQETLNYAANHRIALDHEQALTLSAGVSYHFTHDLLYLDSLYGSGLRSGFANTDHLAPYYPVNVGYEHTLNLNHKRSVSIRLDIVNLFDEVYTLRDGSGIGVFAPQYGARRGFFASVNYSY